VAAGNTTRAARIAVTLSDDHQRTVVVRGVAAALAAAGNVPEAQRTACNLLFDTFWAQGVAVLADLVTRGQASTKSEWLERFAAEYFQE
jgi:hypothetical protein